MTDSPLVGRTTLARLPLSYKWIIDDAEMFLSNRENLMSPEFSLQVPPQVSSSFINLVSSSWHLLIEKRVSHGSIHNTLFLSLCHGAHIGQIRKRAHLELELDKYGFFSPMDKTTSSTTVLVSDCVFTILHPERDEPLYSTTPPTQQLKFEVDDSFKTCCTVQFINYNDIDKYLLHGMLTLQVKATLLSIDSPQETSELIKKVPLDNIREKIHDSYKDHLFTDVVIRCRKDVFKVHKVILASQSPVFKKMFEINMKEKESGVVSISDLSPAVVSSLVTYFYTGTAPNVSTLAKELLNAAKKYELPRLFRICENELITKVQVANVIDTLLLADLYNAALLKQACLKFIHLNLAVLQKTNRWEYLKEHAALLIEILDCS